MRDFSHHGFMGSFSSPWGPPLWAPPGAQGVGLREQLGAPGWLARLAAFGFWLGFGWLRLDLALISAGFRLDLALAFIH